MRQREVFVLNTTGEPQVLKHALIIQLAAIPIMPGGYALTQNDRVTIPAGAAFRIPIRIWNTGACAYKRAWTKEITEAEFVRMAVSDDDPAAAIIAGLEARIAELEEAAAQLTTPEAGASTEGKPGNEVNVLPIKPVDDIPVEPKAEAEPEAHEEASADKPQGEFKCPTCDRTFSMRANLARHIPSCKGQK